MLPELPESMAAHIDRVVEIADALATRHHLDVAQTRLAAQGHDLLRAVPTAELLARAEQRALDIDPVEREVPVILHGPLGALELEERFGLDDRTVLEAIRWHTTGHPDYTPEAWAMFIADKVEPSKLARTPELRPVLDLASESLELAALAYLDFRIAGATEKGQQIHPMANLTRNALLRRGFGAR
jgi:predicted HD superfamily hydrolase involved in NAD metabolism